MEYSGLPGSVLADLYIRLRDEIGCGERNLDPNHKLRARIAMAIFSTEEALGADVVRIETRVREMLGLASRAEAIAA